MIDSKNRVVFNRECHYNTDEFAIFHILRCIHANANG
jgi:hypothetical protein